MSDQQYKVSIKGEGLSLEREVPREVANKLMIAILAAESKSASGDELDLGLGGDSGSEKSIREFLDEVDATVITEKITAVGAFLKLTQRKATYTRDDILTQFEAATEKVPKNPYRDIKKTIAAGWIAEKAGEKDTYYVTNTGNTAVAKKFPKEAVKRANRGSKKPKKPEAET